MRRLFIYLTYDSQNIIDDYIGYFLQSIRPIADTIAVVCNMPHIERGLHNLTDYADHIFYRENAGLDAGGFKDALCRLLGWKLIGQYDELILANDFLLREILISTAIRRTLAAEIDLDSVRN